jgi:hypothetical protein
VEEKARLDLVRNLGAVYNDAWEDEALKDRLIAEPGMVLAEHGIELPATVKVEAELVQAVPDGPRVRLDDFFAEWDRMVERGTVALKVPASRPAGVTITEFSDEELERVSGGIAVPPGNPLSVVPWVGGLL